MATVYDVTNLPSTKILIDFYNLDLTKFSKVADSLSGNVRTSSYVYADGDLTKVITADVRISFNPTANKGVGETYYSVELKGSMSKVVDDIFIYSLPVRSKIDFTFPEAAIGDRTEAMRFINAALFCVMQNTSASAVPVESMLTRLAAGNPNILG